MSRVFNALQRSQRETVPGSIPAISAVELLGRSVALSPGVASVPSFRPVIPPESRIEAFTNPDSFAAEQFRVLGARLRHLSETGPLKAVLLTSASVQEGKSLVCLNLAVTLAKRAHTRVLVVEGDVRKPALSNMLGLPRLRGLSDWIACKEPLTNFICRIADLDLWLLPAGASCGQPLELVQSPLMRELLSQTREEFDWVLIDSAPLLVSDASILSRLADGTLVVVRQERTQKRAVQKCLGAVDKVLGFVLNDCGSTSPRGYDQYYAQDMTHGNGASRPKAPSDAPHPPQDPSRNAEIS
jgi:capsular exopolysaccharide synthesis family protein